MFFNWPDPQQYSICQQRLASWSMAFAIATTLGCGSAPPADPQSEQMVYYDRATKKAVVYNRSSESLVIHPDTGKPTLVPAAYCSQCQSWFPAPPFEVWQRNPKAVVCPKKHALTLDGPWPEDTL